MGKGDKKSVRGKIIMGSYGANRRKKRTPAYVPPVEEVKKPVAKKAEPKVEEPASEAPKAKKAAPKKKATPKAKKEE